MRDGPYEQPLLAKLVPLHRVVGNPVVLDTRVVPHAVAEHRDRRNLRVVGRQVEVRNDEGVVDLRREAPADPTARLRKADLGPVAPGRGMGGDGGALRLCPAQHQLAEPPLHGRVVRTDDDLLERVDRLRVPVPQHVRQEFQRPVPAGQLRLVRGDIGQQAAVARSHAFVLARARDQSVGRRPEKTMDLLRLGEA